MLTLFPSRAVALEIFGFSVHWYGLMYLSAFLLAWVLLPRLQKHRDIAFSADDWSTVISWAVIGVIAGGRLGFVLFYDPTYFLANPAKVLAVWEGGMSFHGGFIGASLAIYTAVTRRGEHWLKAGDVIVIPVAIGLALGRVGNFINRELYGPVTSLPWGMEIPGVPGLRHPTPLYAACKDLLIALLCYLYLRRRPFVPGRTFALFMMLYGVLRFLIEYLRVQEYPLTDLGIVTLTRGQLLTVPVFLLGLLLWWYAGRRTAGSSSGAAGTARA